jgi:hypothetical protein
MTWMTWRQHRAAAVVGGVITVAISAALVWLGLRARADVRHAGLTACLRAGGDCNGAVQQLQHQYHWLPPVAASLFALPLLAGMFWGAPLVAREIETGTHRLVWTQSVSRLRWISSKLVIVLGVAAAATLAVSLLAVWAFQPLIPVLGNRFRGGWFDVQGFLPAAYMLFALALGITIGAVWRRTIPAMAATLVGYAVVRVPLHSYRHYLLPARVKTVSIVLSQQQVAQLTSRSSDSLPNVPSGLGPGAWIFGTSPVRIADRAGGGKTMTTTFRYIASGRFWALQGVEAAIFVALTALLVAVCVTVVARARPT